MDARCDCYPWNPAHEPKPKCTWPNCNADATGMIQHREAGPFECDHLICDTHKTEPDATAEHDFVPLYVLYPTHFQKPKDLPS